MRNVSGISYLFSEEQYVSFFSLTENVFFDDELVAYKLQQTQPTQMNSFPPPSPPKLDNSSTNRQTNKQTNKTPQITEKWQNLEMLALMPCPTQKNSA
jgi:hypothetical protein